MLLLRATVVSKYLLIMSRWTMSHIFSLWLALIKQLQLFTIHTTLYWSAVKHKNTTLGISPWTTALNAFGRKEAISILKYLR